MKISIIITVFNVEKFISRCLDSVFSQTFSDFEVIVVNDATQDHSMEIVSKYAESHPNLSIITNPKNRGLMMARKVGYTCASGEYIIFLDSDDWLPENSIKILYETIITNNADIVSGNAEYTNGTEIIKKTQYKLSYGCDSHSVYKSLLTGEYMHQMWGKIYKRSILLDFEYETKEHFTNSEDFLLFYQIVKNISKISHIDDVVYCYYMNETSATHSINSGKIETILEARRKMWEIVSPIEDLKPLAYKLICSQLSDFCYVGFKEQIKSFLSKNNMEFMLKFNSYVQHFTLKESLMLFLKQNGHFWYTLRGRKN